MTKVTNGGFTLLRGQEVRVRAGKQDLGVGIVDDYTEDREIIWIVFGGAGLRRMFLPEDRAEYEVLPPASVR